MFMFWKRKEEKKDKQEKEKELPRIPSAPEIVWHQPTRRISPLHSYPIDMEKEPEVRHLRINVEEEHIEDKQPYSFLQECLKWVHQAFLR